MKSVLRTALATLMVGAVSAATVSAQEATTCPAMPGQMGHMGPMGFMGHMGPMGYMGQMGPMGYMGHMGPMGYMGQMGPMGYMGHMGPMGYMGHMGPGMPGAMYGLAEGMMRLHAYDPDVLLGKRSTLSLTPDQVSRLETLVKEIRDSRSAAQTRHDAEHARVTAEMEKDSPDAAKVREYARAAMSAMTDAFAAEIASFARAKSLLTTAQREQAGTGAPYWCHQAGSDSGRNQR